MIAVSGKGTRADLYSLEFFTGLRFFRIRVQGASISEKDKPMSLASKIAVLAHLSPPILTAYLDINPSYPRNQSTPRGYIVWLKSAGQALLREVPRDSAKALRLQLRRVDRYLKTGKTPSQSLVIFAGPQVWEVIALQVEVTEELHWGKPSLHQMAWILDEHRPRGAVVINGTGARFFRFWLGTVEESPEYAFSFDVSSLRKPYLVGPSTPGVSKQHGIQRERISARAAAQRRRFLKKASHRIAEWATSARISPIVLVGSVDEIDSITNNLPAELRAQIVSFPKTLPQILPTELSERLKPILNRWEREYEAHVIKDVFAGQRSGQTVIGLRDTLDRLQKNQLRELVVARGLRGSAQQCSSCDWIEECSDATCTICGSKRQTRTLRTLLPELASMYSVPIEVVAGKAGTRLLARGGIAGWLRSARKSSSPKSNMPVLSAAS
jgi:hypothetical protein